MAVLIDVASIRWLQQMLKMLKYCALMEERCQLSTRFDGELQPGRLVSWMMSELVRWSLGMADVDELSSEGFVWCVIPLCYQWNTVGRTCPHLEGTGLIPCGVGDQVVADSIIIFCVLTCLRWRAVCLVYSEIARNLDSVRYWTECN